MKRLQAALLLASALTVAACGTTVPITSQRTISGAPGDLSGSSTGTTTGGSTGSTSTTGSSGTSTGLGGTATSGTGGSTGSSATGTSGVQQTSSTTGSVAPSSPASTGKAANGLGMTATTVKLGLITTNSAAVSAFANAAGVGGGLSDPATATKAVLAYINAHGGMAGRKAEPVFYNYDISKSESDNNNAACALWTQDNKVYAAAPQGHPNNGGVSCLKGRGVISINPTDNPGSVQDFTKYAPYYYAPGALETVSLARENINGLAEHGFFGSGSKVGVVYFDYPEYRTAISQGFTPALAKQGLKIASSYAVTYHGNAAELGNISTAVSNAQLRFAAAGINRVLFLDQGGTLALFFMQQAKNQGRTYKYGLNSTGYAAFLSQQNGISGQLANAVVVGTIPTGDASVLRYTPRNPARDLCFSILKGAGITPQSAADAKTLSQICSGLFFLRDALNKAPNYDPAGFAKGVAALGETADTAASSVKDRFAVGRPWGASARGYATYAADCSCFTYAAGVTSFS